MIYNLQGSASTAVFHKIYRASTVRCSRKVTGYPIQPRRLWSHIPQLRHRRLRSLTTAAKALTSPWEPPSTAEGSHTHSNLRAYHSAHKFAEPARLLCSRYPRASTTAALRNHRT
jgi:hypothetical protein